MNPSEFKAEHDFEIKHVPWIEGYARLGWVCKICGKVEIPVFTTSASWSSRIDLQPKDER